MDVTEKMKDKIFLIIKIYFKIFIESKKKKNLLFAEGVNSIFQL